MAKALMGHLHSDLRDASILSSENRRLRSRVKDLEALVLGLQAENDRRGAAVRDETNAEDLQLA